MAISNLLREFRREFWGSLMQAETDEVQRFITFYDAIRSDKKAPISRCDLDISFLAAQFDRFFSWDGKEKHYSSITRRQNWLTHTIWENPPVHCWISFPPKALQI